MTRHYKDKSGKVYGYRPDEIEVTEMSDAEFKQLKVNQEVQFEAISKLQQKCDELQSIEIQIQRLERIRDRDDSEQAELDALIDESTKLFREIRAEKEKLNDRNA